MQVHPKKAREKKGWTLDKAAEATGVNKSTISRLERGECRPGHDTVVALETAYGLKPGSLVFTQERASA